MTFRGARYTRRMIVPRRRYNRRCQQRPQGSPAAAAINGLVQRLAQRAGLQDADQYSAHSLRSGGATASYKSGAPVSAIASHGRWSPNSPVVLSYIRSVDQWRDNPLSGIGL
jgi:integrase